MPSRGLKFISQFLKPNLNSKKFGTRLMWLNVEHSIFQVQWNHKSASGWTKDDAEVFMEWDKIKGRGMVDDKDRFTKSKQRFRAIMYKLIKANHITEICCSDKYTKVYCFGTKENIAREVIEEALSYRGSTICKISSENLYTCNPAVVDMNEIYGRSFITDNQVNIIEDDKYAILTEVAISESEDMVPDNRLKVYNFCDTSCLYVDIYTESLPEKQDLFHESEYSLLPDSNDCEVTDISNCVKWDDLQYNVYESVPEESQFRPEHLLNFGKLI